MAQLGIKNVSKQKYSGTHDGVIYEFKNGELKVLDSETAMHLVNGSNLSAIGANALKIVPLSEIPEELRKEPDTKTDTLMGVESISGKTVEIMFDGKIFKFPKGTPVFLHVGVANELISRSTENGKPTLAEVKPAPKKEEAKKEEVKNKKEGK